MLRALATAVFVCFSLPVLAQRTLDLTGTWLVDDASSAKAPMASDFKVILRKDGTASLTAFGTKGSGTYRIVQGKIDIRLTKTNDGREHSALGTIAEGGKALLFDTGAVRGPRQVKIRLTRQRR